MADPRTIIGSLVSTKACHVTNLADSTRRYGANAKTKLVVGVVLSSTSNVAPCGHHALTFVTASYTFGGGVVRRKTLVIRSVLLYDGTGAEDGTPIVRHPIQS
jgi:hypothetical protein